MASGDMPSDISGGNIPDEKVAEIQQEAHAWTSALMRSVLEEPIHSKRLWVPASPNPLVDLSDVKTEVVRFGDQIRVCEKFSLNVPVLFRSSTGLAMPVDLTAAVGAEIPEAQTEVEYWLDEARNRVRRLADASPMEYEELAAPQVWALLERGTNSFVTARFLPSLFGGGKNPIYPIDVHTTASGLRVHWSKNIFWYPIYFGAPSPKVTGKLPAGQYQFGVDGHGMAITPDPAVFDIPQVQDAYLTVA